MAAMDETARQWQARARAFARSTIEPASSREWIQDDVERMPWDVIEAGSAAGFRTLAVPPEYGGPDPALDGFTLALIVEEFATADPGITHYFTHCIKDVRQVVRRGTREQKDRFFAAFLADDRFVTAHASTEPGAGADRYLAPAGFRYQTTAVRDGDGWRIDGRKHCIAGGNEAGMVLVQAATDTSKDLADGTTMFMVYRGNPGMKKGQVHDKAGLRMLNNAEIVFEDCFVPDEDVLGTVNNAIRERTGQARDNGMLSMAFKLGVARAAYETALQHASHRVQGGTEIIRHQAVGVKLAEMLAHVETIRSMMYRYVTLDEQAGDDPKFGDVATWTAVESAFRAATLGVQICGCRGTWLDHKAQKHLRDALMYFPNDGTHMIHLLRAHNRMVADAGLADTATPAPAATLA
jgi:alkylation response protein AidB-like acyl-CoA dehydrogenase